MNIAVTGSSGFLGRHLVLYLRKRGHVVTEFNKQINNLFNTSSLKHFVSSKDVVIHLAGVNRADRDEMFSVNVLGTQHLVEAITEYSPATRLLFASSVQVYLPESFYGLTKKLAEKTISYYCVQHGLSATTLRMTNLYGPGAKPYYNCAVATFLDQVMTKKAITLHGSGKQQRDFLYVDDAVAAIEKTIAKKWNRFVSLDICSGKKSSLLKVIQIVESLTGKKATIKFEKTSQEAWVFRTRHVFTMRELSWRPQTSLSLGIQKMIKAYEHSDNKAY